MDKYELMIAEAVALEERKKREKERILKLKNDAIDGMKEIISNVKIDGNYFFKVIDKRGKKC